MADGFDRGESLDLIEALVADVASEIEMSYDAEDADDTLDSFALLDRATRFLEANGRGAGTVRGLPRRHVTEAVDGDEGA